MSKERLEEIKQQLEESNSYDDNPNGYWYRNINWLIQQAERVQELEGERDEWRDTSQSYYMTNQELRGKNKRYREAVEYVITAKPTHYKNLENALVDITHVIMEILEEESE